MTNANVTLSPYERAVNILNELTPRQDTIISAALDDLLAALATAQAERDAALAERDAAQGETLAARAIITGLRGEEACDGPRLIDVVFNLKAERDAARATAQQDRELHDARSARRIKRIEALEAALTGARRVLREASGWLEPEISRGPADARWVQMMRDVAAVLAQEEQP